MMQYRYLSIACLVVAINIGHTDDSGNYSGSQAFNKSQLQQESVNAATGTFDFSYPLIHTKGYVSPFQMQLSYRYNSVGMFGLPTGWQFDIDYIDGKSARLHGQQWLIDDLWHDEIGFASGLKYYNLHGTRFIDEGVAKEIPSHKGISYRYQANYKDGSIKYFSHQGLLVLEQDRFNNILTFEYQMPVKELTTAKITKITDNYGNQYTFSYAPNEIILHYPDHRIVHIYLNDQGVMRVTNPLNQNTSFEYIQQDSQNLLRKIETPTGLITRLSYGSINYKSSSSTKKMPVVSHYSKQDKATNKTLRETHYTYSTDNNFTGYPVYGLSDNSDSLMDSDNQGYRYSVEISQSDLNQQEPQLHKKIFYYNYLHLPVEVHTLKHGKQHLKTTYEYAISPFKYSRSTNYDKPATVSNYLWDEGHNLYVPSDKTTSRYDNYGNQIEEQKIVFDRLYWQWTPLSSKKKTYFIKNYNLDASTTRIDELSGKQIKTQYHLAKNGKTHAKKITDYLDKKDDKTWKLWKQSTLAHDSHGRVTYSSSEWTAKDKTGPQKTSVKTSYYYNNTNSFLTVNKESALGSIRSEIIDTRNGNKLQSQTPMREKWFYYYDAIGRLTKTIDPLYQIVTKDHLDYQTSFSNSIIEKSPLKYIKRTEYDAIGQVTHHQDYHDEGWRDLESYDYSGWGKITKKTNSLGLSEITQYDEQQRPISSTDQWKNIKTITYNDLHLTTTTYLNKHKTSEKVSIPWSATIHERKFPVFDNLHDPQEFFVEETVQKNGLGQKTLHSSSLVHRYTLKTSEMITTNYNYDASNNPIEKTLTGFDGIQYKRTVEYDLFNNKVSHQKSVTANNDTTNHQGDTFIYNEDNLLTDVTSPPMLCGQAYTTHHTYDKNGQKIKTTLPDSREMLFKYDPIGQLTQSSWQRDSNHYEVSNTYDADRRLVTVSDNDNQKIQYSYTPNGKLTQLTYPDSRSLRYTYDDKDRVITLADFNNTQQNFIYNPEDHGKLSEIHHKNNTISLKYGVDDNGHYGRLIQRTMDFEKEGKTESHYYYGPLNSLTKVSTINHQAGAIYNLNYRFKPRGELVTQSVHSHRGHASADNTAANYTYDSLNRLINELNTKNHVQVDIDYLYDGNNNLLQEDITHGNCKETINYTYNELDQLVASTSSDHPASMAYEYSPNGHMMQDGQGTAYSYDDHGFLLSVTPTKGKAVHYHYLPNGLLGSRQADKSNHHFYHDNNKKIITQNLNNEWLSLMRSNRTIIAGISNEGIDQVYKAHQSTGAVLTREGTFSTSTYEGYGTRHGDAKELSGLSHYGWNQEFTDLDNNLTYLRSRFYDSSLKRFISKDSYAIDNRYTFGKANPITYIDPTGHSAQQALNYGLGSGITALGIIGAIFAIPTGGASLTLSAGAGIASGVTAALSGISLMGSQGALDSGNKQAAKALQYTSIGLGVVALVEAGVAIAPSVSASFFTASSSRASSLADISGGSVSSTVDIPASEQSLIASSSEGSYSLSPKETIIYDTVGTSPKASYYSRLLRRYQGLVSDDIPYEPRSYIQPESSSSSRVIYARPPQIHLDGVWIAGSSPPATDIPIIPGSFSSEESIYVDMSGINAVLEGDFYEDMSGTQLLDDVVRSSLNDPSS